MSKRVVEDRHRPLGEGAGQGAPTAPHATPRVREGRRTGPELFWAHWPVRVALGASLLVSGLAHCTVLPLEIPRGLEMNEVEGEAAIPIDVLAPEDEPPPPPAVVEPPPPAPEDKAPEGPPLAPSLRPKPDAGLPQDASSDAPADALADARPTDASGPGDAGRGEDGAAPLAADAGPVASGPRDPQAVVGAAGDIQVDKVLVMLIVNAEEIRKNPEGATLGFLLKGIPQWDMFMHGTDIDPVRDTDWLMISGPSLANTTRDVVLIRYSAPDAKIDKAMDVAAANFAKGGPYDAGVPTVRAVRTFADDSERVVMRPKSHVLAVVPPQAAEKVAHQLARANVPAHIRKGEALYLRVFDPHHPMPDLPASITEMRLRVLPRDDDGADIEIEGDTRDADSARQAARDLKALVESRNGTLVQMFTHGILDGFDTSSEGTLVKGHLTASRDQIAAVVNAVATMVLHVQRAPSPGPAPGGSARPPR